MTPGTRTLNIAGSPLAGDIFAVTGEQHATLPTALDDEVECELEAVVNAAKEYLTSGGDQREQNMSAGQYLDRVRTQPLYRRANSIILP